MVSSQWGMPQVEDLQVPLKQYLQPPPTKQLKIKKRKHNDHMPNVASMLQIRITNNRIDNYHIQVKYIPILTNKNQSNKNWKMANLMENHYFTQKTNSTYLADDIHVSYKGSQNFFYYVSTFV